MRETCHLGPLWLLSQWTMEQVISYLGSLLRQPSNPFRNLTAQTMQIATMNTLIAMWPDLDKPKGIPRGLMDLGDHYRLLGPKDTTSYCLQPSKQMEFIKFFGFPQGVHQLSIYQWGHLKLPTDQITQSQWKEMEQCSNMARTDRNIKVCELIYS